MTAEKLLGRLDGVIGKGPWRAICPAHQSKNRTRSLAVSEEPDGRVLLHCFAGCDVYSVVGAVGLELTDLFPDKPIPDGKKPHARAFSERDLFRLYRRELGVAWVILRDIAKGRAISVTDRKRAEKAAQTIEAIESELA